MNAFSHHNYINTLKLNTIIITIFLSHTVDAVEPIGRRFPLAVLSLRVEVIHVLLVLGPNLAPHWHHTRHRPSLFEIYRLGYTDGKWRGWRHMSGWGGKINGDYSYGCKFRQQCFNSICHRGRVCSLACVQGWGYGWYCGVCWCENRVGTKFHPVHDDLRSTSVGDARCDWSHR